MTATIRIVFALSLAVLFASCGVRQSMDDATAGIEEFHASFDKEQFDSIWKTTSTELRKMTDKDQFQRLLVAIHDKLGAVKSSEQQGWQTNNTNGITTVVISNQTTFEKGKGVETFTFIYEGEALRLQGYYIQSDALIIG